MIDALIVFGIVIYAIAYCFTLSKMLYRDVEPFLAIFLSTLPIFNIYYPFRGCNFKEEWEKLFEDD